MPLPVCGRRGARFAAQFALVLFIHAAGATLSMASNQPLLVITGASYAAQWEAPQLPGYTVVNKGKGGDETRQVLARFDADVLALKPSAVLIWGHINNYHRAPNGDLEAAKKQAWADTQEMIRRARAQGVTVILATEVTLSEAVGFTNRVVAFINGLRGKTSYAARINEPVRAVNAQIRQYGRDQGLRVLDIEKLFDDGEGFRKVEYSADDGSHISAAGYAALTPYAQKQLGAR
jgi:lysophospholipase L1-like esterase